MSKIGLLTKNLNDYEFELIFVDDGSTDKSLELLKHELLSFSSIKFCHYQEILDYSLLTKLD